MPKLTRIFQALLFCAAIAAHAANPLEVKTAPGKVEGVLTPDGKVRAFKGIPYAAPPVGPLRWQPPQPAAPWKGVRAAKDFGPHCFQSNSYPDMVFHDPGPSEDCLTLNIWTPTSATPGKNLPVMLWIYGGGLETGSTSEFRQDGQYLAHRNVVVVSMNYRLGILGFFAHPALTAESPHHASGNYGLMDQSAALAWVHANIRNFGGDPANITIFGESAGSQSVSAQMASPLSRGLLAKAIGESGAAFHGTTPSNPPLPQIETRNVAFAQAAYNTSNLPALRALSPEQLLQPITSGAHRQRFNAIVDGYFLPQSADAIFAAGRQAHVPLLAGWNANEQRSPITTAAAFTELVQKDFADQAPQLLAAYPAATDAEAAISAGDLASDRWIAFTTWRWIEAHTKTGAAPVYRYHLELGSPGDKNHSVAAGAFHSDDIEYIFGTLDSRPQMAIRPEDRALSEQMASYWTNFARTGNPNDPGLPNWPPYKPTDFQVMHLDATSAATPDAHRDRYLFLDRFYPTK